MGNRSEVPISFGQILCFNDIDDSSAPFSVMPSVYGGNLASSFSLPYISLTFAPSCAGKYGFVL